MKIKILIAATVMFLLAGCIPSPDEVAMRLENKASNTTKIQSGNEQITGDVIFAINAKSKDQAVSVFNSIRSELANRSFRGRNGSYRNISGRMVCSDWWEAGFDNQGTTLSFVGKGMLCNIQPIQMITYDFKEVGGKYFIYIKSSTGMRKNIGESLLYALVTSDRADAYEDNGKTTNYKKANQVIIDAISRTGRAIDLRNESPYNHEYRKAWIQGMQLKSL